MANHKSAIKRARQNERRRLSNKMTKTRVKNISKSVKLSAAESPEKAQENLKEAMRIIDKAASRGTLHRKTASRKISRLAKLVFKSQSADSA